MTHSSPITQHSSLGLTAMARTVLELLQDAGQALTVHQVTRRYQREMRIHTHIGPRIRSTLDDLVREGLAEYLDGMGNNRRYRALEAS